MQIYSKLLTKGGGNTEELGCLSNDKSDAVDAT